MFNLLWKPRAVRSCQLVLMRAAGGSADLGTRLCTCLWPPTPSDDFPACSPLLQRRAQGSGNPVQVPWALLRGSRGRRVGKGGALGTRGAPPAGSAQLHPPALAQSSAGAPALQPSLLGHSYFWFETWEQMVFLYGPHLLGSCQADLGACASGGAAASSSPLGHPEGGTGWLSWAAEVRPGLSESQQISAVQSSHCFQITHYPVRT